MWGWEWGVGVILYLWLGGYGWTVVERYAINCCTSYIVVPSVIAMLKKLTESVWIGLRGVDEKSKNHWIFI